MKTSLVSVTQSSFQQMTAEQLIVYVARVSNPSNQVNNETAPKLIAYLVKNKHWSPFEMADMTVEIITSRGIAQQILRHRSFSFQEFSQRYAKVTEMEPVQLRLQSASNRQSSTEEFDPMLKISKLSNAEMQASVAIDAHVAASQQLYESLLEAGVAKECARFVLPITTQTRIYMKGSVRSWIHYLQIRCDEHVQLEHRQVAEGIREIFRQEFPNIAEALSL